MANDRPAQSEIKLLITKGLEQGYLTYAEVNDHLPDDIVDPEQIEDIIGMINDMGIEVHETAPDAESLLLSEAAVTTSDEAAMPSAARPGDCAAHSRPSCTSAMRPMAPRKTARR